MLPNLLFKKSRLITERPPNLNSIFSACSYCGFSFEVLTTVRKTALNYEQKSQNGFNAIFVRCEKIDRGKIVKNSIFCFD